MQGFVIKTEDNTIIRFHFYMEEAPVTCNAFINELPFTRTFAHARFSGQEIWISDAPELDIIQENASVFTDPGEVVIGPLKPSRVKTAKCLGIYYGEGKGLDSANVFAKVFDEDLHLLITLGEQVWKHGQQQLTFEVLL